MNIFETVINETKCDGCGKYWLGKLFGKEAKPLCNECYAEMVADQEQRYAEPMSESEEYRLAN